MPYTYEPVPGLFKVTTWEENVSHPALVVCGVSLPPLVGPHAFPVFISVTLAPTPFPLPAQVQRRHGKAARKIAS
ncbi:hypothetical protein A1Q2_04981 [Trichosporon asahii var. asahii CBS 8904]|uniref:Uncharacterized protein n=2 Tax=Trichosporon asahii var. asahii TaxID=189963 RepID=K1WH52_TRIAC|nr:hypothetical protein A1Q1_00882 [Trichosporon asahii var. asahii CBS 2479]EJT49964.1 hypothetical protein A1Q1_00882 [Trichosporon asahii var. asahii CBS 2479]EKD00789.1 hypothetical protein A1Q2_04981 [Trichosporon asahii var. asahii CBS 8904]